jgi:3-oxoacyl-[acyl-carrier-protein] synthase II
MTGHLLGAAGGIESVICVKVDPDRESSHPTMNLVDPDPDCDLDYVPNVARELEG